MIELTTSRSRNEDYRRCNRARWNLHERAGTGFELVRQAVPLVTGSAIHVGLAALLKARIQSDPVPFSETEIDLAASIAVASYEKSCQGRGLEIDVLEAQSFIFNEQRSLVEALVRLGGLRVIPRLLEIYEILEVEQLDKRELASEIDFKILWRSIPDSLMRNRTDDQLYLLSWKTCGEIPKENEARIDMQGVSEAWAIQPKLKERMIRGVQMVYFVKGSRRSLGKEQMIQLGIPEGQKVYKSSSPLIYGYSNNDQFSAKFAHDLFWTCSDPHSFKWAKGGVCPGNKNHKLGDNWSSFSSWSVMGVKDWIRMLDSGNVDPKSIDVLGDQWSMPVPNYRTQDQMKDWFEQTQAQEVRIAKDLIKLRELEQGMSREWQDEQETELASALNQSVLGPQTTNLCTQWFGRKCPSYEICHGPSHVQSDPVASGIYQVKTKFDESVERAETLEVAG